MHSSIYLVSSATKLDILCVTTWWDGLLESVCKIAMEQHKTTLRGWINEMASEQTPVDEIALYILSRMYRKHAFVYTQMFWWTTLLYM